MHPALAILQICVGVNKINTFVVLPFYLYPGKVILPDLVKTVKKFQNKMLHVLLLFEREKKKNLLVEFMMLWHHIALAI